MNKGTDIGKVFCAAGTWSMRALNPKQIEINSPV